MFLNAKTARKRRRRNKELVSGFAGSHNGGRQFGFGTGAAINDINATTSKHGFISSRAGGIINNKFW